MLIRVALSSADSRRLLPESGFLLEAVLPQMPVDLLVDVRREQLVAGIGEADVQRERGEGVIDHPFFDDDAPRERVVAEIVRGEELLEARLRGLLARRA